ncbi:hypothetical protein [Streptomyces sp. ITFR-16]|uniref:hypothetical protein n=1 Tax=Streptomyces sp. ITFR-16 TaxID=3075198 RepID=UPI00288A1AF7|nr:hypothetical protein [Streptomyces sp. ITFR-16]WNI27191.1 hypothetical protein RLT58_35200 [Streptomyces sp. ITFR-16]
MMMRGVVMGVMAAVVVFGVAGAVAVPEARQWYEGRHEEMSSYATGAEAKAARDSVPRWLPDDASSVEYAMRTTGGQRILKASLAESRLPTSCKPLGGRDAPAPEINASWFPSDLATRAQVRCGSYYAVLDHRTLYAWQTNADWVEGNRSS